MIGSTYYFIPEDENDYVVIIRDANKFMEEEELHFTVRALGAVKYFTVKEKGQGEYIFEIYCITDDTVPDAPPRIIVRSEQ